MRNILIAGDTHGDFNHVRYLTDIAARAACDAIVQVGDFGFYWPGQKSERLLGRLKNHLAHRVPPEAGRDIPLYFLDGNHEDFSQLRNLGVFGADLTEPQEMARNLFYLPRGCRWEWNGVRMAALGGAVSTDRATRIEFRSWWADEAIKQSDQIILGDEPVDILFTHDVLSCESLSALANESLGEELLNACNNNRKHIEAAVERLSPKILFHGHYHHRHSVTIGEMQIEGLNCNLAVKESWAILDLESRTFSGCTF